LLIIEEIEMKKKKKKKKGKKLPPRSLIGTQTNVWSAYIEIEYFCIDKTTTTFAIEDKS